MPEWSQSGEEAFIREWAKERAATGHFLDLGSADGTSASNTRWLALQGWSGVCVEPAAWAFDALTELYSDRFDIALVQAAVVLDPMDLVRFHYAHDLLSTTVEKNAETWREAVSFTPVWVATLSVDDLLYGFPGPYDMVSVDTEGTSVEIWDALRQLGAFAPGALAVIEAEDGIERWEIQQACLDGWRRVATTPNNVLLSAPL